jgi:hypothetical protein
MQHTSNMAEFIRYINALNCANPRKCKGLPSRYKRICGGLQKHSTRKIVARRRRGRGPRSPGSLPREQAKWQNGDFLPDV